jgi:hypothetical protein
VVRAPRCVDASDLASHPKLGPINPICLLFGYVQASKVRHRLNSLAHAMRDMGYEGFECTSAVAKGDHYTGTLSITSVSSNRPRFPPDLETSFQVVIEIRN